MRVKTGTKPIAVISLIILSAILLFCFAIASPAANADTAKPYLQAKILLNGDFLPASLSYDPEAVRSYGFSLNESPDRKSTSQWRFSSCSAAQFSLKIFDTDGVEIIDPTAVGTYTVRVVALSDIPDYSNGFSGSLTLDEGDVVAEATFRIEHVALAILCDPLDKQALGTGSALVLDSLHTDYYGDVTSASTVSLKGAAIPTDKRTLTVEYYSAGAFSTTATIAVPGEYRLKAVIDPSVDLDSLTTLADRTIYREFEVSRSLLGLSLNKTFDYLDKSPSFTLSSTTPLVGSSFDTQIFLFDDRSEGEVGRVVATAADAAIDYAPTQAGRYLYRVVFKSAWAERGIAAGDEIDLPFTVDSKPYVIRYSDTSGLLDEYLEYELVNPSADNQLDIIVGFYYPNGDPVGAVAPGETRRYTVRYQRYFNSAWQDHGAPGALPDVEGRYRAVLTITDGDPITVASGYTLHAGDVIYGDEFQVMVGDLHVSPVKGELRYTGTGISPEIRFRRGAANVSYAPSLYTVRYYDADGTLRGSTPVDVGEYYFGVVFNDEPSREYRGRYRITYTPISAILSEGSASFLNGDTSATLDPTITYVYYERVSADNLLRKLDAAPSDTDAGEYVMRAIFGAALPVTYDYDVNDFAQTTFVKSPSKTFADIDFSGVPGYTVSGEVDHMPFDGGGVILPSVSFKTGGLSGIVSLTEFVDYQVSYFKNVAGVYTPCGYPVYAGKYVAVVTYLRTDADKGITGGTYDTRVFEIDQRSINVSFAPTEACADYVYDGARKVLVPTFFRDNFAVAYSSDPVVYGVSTDALTTDYACINVGDYYASVSLTDDRESSLRLRNETISFSIERLLLDVRFTVLDSYDAMWSGAGISPIVEYRPKNGQYRDVLLVDQILFAKNVAYFDAEDTPIGSIAPSEPGEYKVSVTLPEEVAANVWIASVSSGSDAGSSPDRESNVSASQGYHIYPRKVQVDLPMNEPSDDLRYKTGEPYGVVESGIRFYSCDSDTSRTEIDFFDGIFDIDYYASDSSHNRVDDPLGAMPTEEGEYIAVLTLIESKANMGRYTFDGGREYKETGDVDLDGKAVSVGSYVYKYFRIKVQEKVDVLFDLPDSFTEGTARAIGIEFYIKGLRTSVLDADCAVTYQKQEGDSWSVATAAAPSEEGKYRAVFTFKSSVEVGGKNIRYSLSHNAGYQAADPTKPYLCAEDVIFKEFSISPVSVMTVLFLAPDSLTEDPVTYYTGEAKTRVVSFTARGEDGLDAKVALTPQVDYKLEYATSVNPSYSAAAFSAPGIYTAKVTFLRALPDFKIGEGSPIEKGDTVIYEFTIAKAQLLLTGFRAIPRAFNGEKTVALGGENVLIRVKTDADGKPFGKIDANAIVTDSLTASCASEIPGTYDVSVSEQTCLSLLETYFGEDASDYYTIESDVVSATISKKILTIVAYDGRQASEEGASVPNRREYDPYYPYKDLIEYDLSASDREELRVTLGDEYADFFAEGSDYKALFTGALSRVAGVSVGAYKILLNDLTLNEAILGAALSSCFEIALQQDEEGPCFVIYERIVIFSMESKQKIYAEPDPAFVLEASGLLYGHSRSYSIEARRAGGENVGKYPVRVTDLKIFDAAGNDVSLNYKIYVQEANRETPTQVISGAAVDAYTTAYLTITPKLIKIAVQAQTGYYTDPFRTELTSQTLSVFDGVVAPGGETDWTKNDAYFDTSRDHVSGVLIKDPNDDTLISPERIRILNAKGENVGGNYTIVRVEALHTILIKEIELFIPQDAVLEKYYGDPDPIIRFTPADPTALGSLNWSSVSTPLRELGEDVGTYLILERPSAAIYNFSDYYTVTDKSGRDVTEYFTFKITFSQDRRDVFEIKPREVVVAVEDAAYENTGRAVTPNILYLTKAGDKVPDSVVALMKNKYVLPEVNYIDGVNEVTAVVDGTAVNDPNFIVTLKPGKITMVYLENRVTAVPLSSDDEIAKDRKYILSGLMLYKPVKFYKLETANGEQPSREVDITLPLDETIKGSGLVAVALYADGSSGVFSFEQNGNYVIYQDGSAYYVVIAEVQEWFIIVWGVAIIFACVILYFIVFLIVKAAKKSRAKKAAREEAEEGEEETPKRKKRKVGFGSIGDDVDAQKADDLAFIDNMVLTESTKSTAKQAPAQERAEIEIPGNTDELFSSEAVVYSDEQKAAPAPASSSENELLSDPSLMLEDAPTLSAVPAPKAAPKVEPKVEPKAAPKAAYIPPAPVASQESSSKSDKKAKKEKEKKEKEKKSDKKKVAEEPKGFRPMAFVPKGNKASVYAPTRSYKDDLFLEEEEAEKKETIVEQPTDNEIVIPDTTEHNSNDEIVISRSNGFTLEDEPEEKKDDDDLM